MESRLNLTILSSIKAISCERTVYRAVVESFRDKVLSTEGNRYFPGRYHLSGEGGVLYTSLTKEVAVKEIERHALRALLQGSLVIAEVSIRLDKVLDLTQTATLRTLGLSKSDLILPDVSICQAVSIKAREAGFRGLIVPSATGAGDNLIIFENNLGQGCLIEIGDVKLIE
ncbi:MAG: RES family NAD+ phosphorylase [Nitrospira sp.]|nr:RES family NAD+ phosphorylase [Nitrospira sp.]